MAVKSTYDPATNVGKVRLKIQDKDTSDTTFDDAEINAFLTEAGELASGSAKILAASGLALLSWAVQLGQDDESVSVGAWKGDRRDVAGKMEKLAERYFNMAGYSPGGQAPYWGIAHTDWTPAVEAEREALD